MFDQVFGLLGLQQFSPQNMPVPSQQGRAQVSQYEMLNLWPTVDKSFQLYGNLNISDIIKQRGLPNDVIQKLLETTQEHLKKNDGQSLFDGFNPYDNSSEGKRRGYFNAMVALLQNYGIRNLNADGFPPAYVLMERFNQLKASSMAGNSTSSDQFH